MMKILQAREAIARGAYDVGTAAFDIAAIKLARAIAAATRTPPPGRLLPGLHTADEGNGFDYV